MDSEKICPRSQKRDASLWNIFNSCKSKVTTQEKYTDYEFTFYSALMWMQTHQRILRIALKLLVTYPLLLQEPSCNCLWNYLKPFLVTIENLQNTKEKY